MSTHLTDAEEKLAELIWANSPLTSPMLVGLAESEIGWKKSTTYTILKNLCNKGVFRNDNSSILIVISRTEFQEQASIDFLNKSYGGDTDKLAAFLAKHGNTKLRDIPESSVAKGKAFVQQLLRNENSTKERSISGDIVEILRNEIAFLKSAVEDKQKMIQQLENEIAETEHRINDLNLLTDSF